MAEETKKAVRAGGLLKMALGIVVVFSGIALTVVYFDVLKTIFLGCIGPFLILAGLVIMAIAKE